MDTVRLTCSICGSAFIKPAEALSLYCPTCQAIQPKLAPSAIGSLSPTAHDTAADLAVDATVISPTVNMDADERFAATIDVVPPGETRVSSASHAHPDQGRAQFGRFQVLSTLGQGAFGTVYHAFDPLLDREVALKVPRFSQNDQAMMERFHREAKSAARLHHPNIVALYENGQTDEGPYLVSEFVSGVTLLQVIRNKGFSIRTAVDWVRLISEALYYAHTEGIIHRDIKPGNIMINRAGRPQVMDFGLAKRDVDEESNVTVEGQILGTPNYMSPEQARGTIAAIGPHSDQYSMGVVLYELLCGTTPFVGPPLAVLSRVANGKDLPPTPRSLQPRIPRDLEACCLKAMEKDPKLRYPNLQALAIDLDHWLSGLPLLARPIGPAERLTRWCRKNRMIASLTGTLAAILLVLAIVGPWLAYRFKNLADHAEAQAAKATTAGEQEKTARALERAARLDAERILVDNYTESGLAADRNGDPRAAVLWFGNSIAASTNHPDRERLNRIRMQSWLPQFAVPIRAFSHPPTWSKLLNYHPHGQALLSVSNSGEANWMDLATATHNSIPLPHPITAAAWSPNGRQLAAASRQIVAVFEHPSGTELLRWECPDAINCLQFSPDGELLFLGGQKTVQIHDVSKQALRTPLFEVGSPVKAIEISPDSGRFAIRTDDHRFLVFSADPDQTSAEPLLPPQPAVSEGEILPIFITNDRLVLVDNAAHAIRCWDLATKMIVWEQPANRVLNMTLSPNRQWLAVGDDSTVLLLDVAARPPLRAQIRHRNLIYGLAFNHQSNLLLTASNADSIQMFDVPTGKPACAPIPHNSAAHRCVWSPDGSTFATVNWGGQVVRVWKPGQTTPTEAAAPNSANGPFVRFNSTGDRWLPSGFDGRRDRGILEIVDTKTGRAVGSQLAGPGLISDADFVPRSSTVVLALGGSLEESRSHFKDQNPDSAGFVRFVDSNTGQATCPDVSTPTQPVAVRVSPDGVTAVVLCHRGQVLLLETASGNLRATVQAFGGTDATHGYVIRDRIRISPRNDVFAIWGSKEVAEVRDLQTGELRYPLRHTRDFIHDVQFSPDGCVIASCSSDHTARLWDSTSGTSLSAPLHHPGWIFSAQFSQDGKRLLTACDDRHARIWDVATGVSALATHEQPDQVFGVCFLPGDEFFLACDRSGQLTAWESRYGKMIAPARRMPGMVYQLSLGRQGTDIIASGRIQPNGSFRWNDWIADGNLPLGREEMRQLGEILSAQRVHEGGAVISLTSAEWMQRWQQFHTRHSLSAIVEGR